MTIKITKQLATMEDLAIGTGTVVQERNGVPLTLTKIDFNSRVIRVTSIAAMEAYSAPVGYVFSLNAGGRSGTFDVVAGDFSSELAADTENGIYIGLADDPTATTKVAKRRSERSPSGDWFGAVGDGLVDDTTAINAAMSSVNDFGEVFFPFKKYAVDGVGADRVNMVGRAELVPAAGATSLVKLGKESEKYRFREVLGLSLDGQGTGTVGFTMKDIAGNQNIYAGRWRLVNVHIKDCSKGIEKLYGNIVNSYNGMSVVGCDFGYWARGATSSDPDFNEVMHNGQDVFEQGSFNYNNKAAFYIDNAAGNGGAIHWNLVTIQSSPIGIFVKRSSFQRAPLIINGCWFENNFESGDTVAIDGVNYETADMHFINTNLVSIVGTFFSKIVLESSEIVLDYCAMNINTNFVFDDSSSIIINNASMDDYKSQRGIVVNSISAFIRESNSTSALFAVPTRQKITSIPSQGNVLLFDDGSTAKGWGGTTTVTSSSVTDGLSYGTAQELTLPAGNTNFHPTSINKVSGKYYVTLLELKTDAGGSLEQSITIFNSGTLMGNCVPSTTPGEWTTIASISLSDFTGNVNVAFKNNDSVSLTTRHGALQVVEFDKKVDAIRFLNSRDLVTG